jgi:hypothetical protein
MWSAMLPDPNTRSHMLLSDTATVRRPRRALELRTDHAIDARPQQARRRLAAFPPFDKPAGGLLKASAMVFAQENAGRDAA